MTEPFVDPSIQQRLRLLLNLRGGPLVTAADFVQPVAVLSEWAPVRNPALETGDEIPKRFWAEDAVAAVAAEFSQVSIRTTDANFGLLIDRVIITNPSATPAAFFIGIVPNTEALHTQSGRSRYVDMRLPGASLVASPVDIGGDTAAALPTAQGRLRIQLAAGAQMDLDLGGREVVLTNAREGGAPSSAPESLAVTMSTANLTMSVSFMGYVFPWGPIGR